MSPNRADRVQFCFQGLKTRKRRVNSAKANKPQMSENRAGRVQCLFLSVSWKGPKPPYKNECNLNKNPHSEKKDEFYKNVFINVPYENAGSGGPLINPQASPNNNNGKQKQVSATAMMMMKMLRSVLWARSLAKWALLWDSRPRMSGLKTRNQQGRINTLSWRQVKMISENGNFPNQVPPLWCVD